MTCSDVRRKLAKWWTYSHFKEFSKIIWALLLLLLFTLHQFRSVQSLSHVWLFATPWTAAYQSSLSFAISQSLLKLKSTESVMSSNHLILCHPLLFLPSIFPRIKVSSNELAVLIRWPKYWSFSFRISPSTSNEYSGLISFRIDCFDLAVQGTLKSFLQCHSSKASILWHSAFFMVQLSHPYSTTEKTTALTGWTFSILFVKYLDTPPHCQVDT